MNDNIFIKNIINLLNKSLEIIKKLEIIREKVKILINKYLTQSQNIDELNQTLEQKIKSGLSPQTKDNKLTDNDKKQTPITSGKKEQSIYIEDEELKINNKIQCPICLDQKNENKMVFLKSDCKHKICIDCNKKLSCSDQYGRFIDLSLHKCPICMRFKPSNNKKLDEWLNENLVDGKFPDKMLGYICHNCSKPFLKRTLCSTSQITSKYNECDECIFEINKNTKLNEMNIKKCPNEYCKIYIEKSHGCDHMECQCKTHFCFGCLYVFSRNNYDSNKIIIDYLKSNGWKCFDPCDNEILDDKLGNNYVMCPNCENYFDLEYSSDKYLICDECNTCFCTGCKYVFENTNYYDKEKILNYLDSIGWSCDDDCYNNYVDKKLDKYYYS